MTGLSIPLKRCRKCGNEYPATLEYFHKTPLTFDRLHLNCKVCENELRRQRYAKNTERAHEYQRMYRAQNLKKTREATHLWTQANFEKRRESKRQWWQAHPEKKRESNRRRRARKANLPGTFTTEHERLALDYFNGCCAVCGRPLRDLFGTHTVHFDHWVPLSKGGGTTPENMVPLCGGQSGCNNSKADKLPVDWLQSKLGKRKATEVLARIQAYFDSVTVDTPSQ